MKTTHLFLTALIGVSLFLGGCGTQLTNAVAGVHGGALTFETAHTGDRNPHDVIEWSAAANPLAKPSRTQK